MVVVGQEGRGVGQGWVLFIFPESQQKNGVARVARGRNIQAVGSIDNTESLNVANLMKMDLLRVLFFVVFLKSVTYFY